MVIAALAVWCSRCLEGKVERDTHAMKFRSRAVNVLQDGGVLALGEIKKACRVALAPTET